MNVNPIKININGVTHEVHVSSINDHSIQLCIDGKFFELQITPSIHKKNRLENLLPEQILLILKGTQANVTLPYIQNWKSIWKLRKKKYF